MRTLTSFLCDRWQEGQGDPALLRNPTTGEAVATASTEGLDLAAALDHARRVGGPALRALSYAERGERLRATSRLIHEHREELLALSTLNAGTTRSGGKFDIDGASFTLAHYARLGEELGAAKHCVEEEVLRLDRGGRVVGRHAFLPRRGVAIHINAFNFPAWGFAEKAACALLAGMPVLCKPATATALTAWRLFELVVEAAIWPAGSLSLLAGSAGDLLDHVDVHDVIAFTGSADTGVRIRSHRAVIANSVPVNVEADSLNSAVLGPDVEAGSATWDAFLRDVQRDMTQKSGQKCTAIRRIMVPEAQLDAVREELSARLAAVTIGDPALKETTMGPLATARQQADGRAGVARLLEEARLVHGDLDDFQVLGADAEVGAFLPPLLLACDDPVAARIVHAHEVFGPVATLLPYDGSAEQAVSLIERGRGSLVSTLYSDDRAWSKDTLLGAAPWLGRLMLVSKRVADTMPPPGTVLPGLVHGGPGRAGGGEELGGLRGMRFYQQRTAIQGDGALLERLLGLR